MFLDRQAVPGAIVIGTAQQADNLGLRLTGLPRVAAQFGNDHFIVTGF